MRIKKLAMATAAIMIWSCGVHAETSGVKANAYLSNTERPLESSSQAALPQQVAAGVTLYRVLGPDGIVPSEARTQFQQPAVDPASRQNWSIAPDDKTLQATLARWARMADWQLSWELPVDYAIELRATISGTFEEAVDTVTKTMEKAEVPIKAIFYKGNKVLRIVVKGGA